MAPKAAGVLSMVDQIQQIPVRTLDYHGVFAAGPSVSFKVLTETPEGHFQLNGIPLNLTPQGLLNKYYSKFGFTTPVDQLVVLRVKEHVGLRISCFILDKDASLRWNEVGNNDILLIKPEDVSDPTMMKFEVQNSSRTNKIDVKVGTLNTPKDLLQAIYPQLEESMPIENCILAKVLEEAETGVRIRNLDMQVPLRSQLPADFKGILMVVPADGSRILPERLRTPSVSELNSEIDQAVAELNLMHPGFFASLGTEALERAMRSTIGHGVVPPGVQGAHVSSSCRGPGCISRVCEGS